MRSRVGLLAVGTRTVQRRFLGTVLGIALTVLFCTIAPAQDSDLSRLRGRPTFAPYLVYLHPERLSWSFGLDRTSDQLIAAARTAAEELGLDVTQAEEVLEFQMRDLTGAQLDKYCTYPILKYQTWKPASSFAIEHRNAINWRLKREAPREVALQGVVSLELSLSADADGAHTLQSICAARLKSRGVQGQYLVESTPNGKLGKRFLELVFKELGIGATVQVGPVARLEPSRENSARDLYVARNCLGGVSVDPESRELVCIGPTQIRDP